MTMHIIETVTEFVLRHALSFFRIYRNRNSITYNYRRGQMVQWIGIIFQMVLIRYYSVINVVKTIILWRYNESFEYTRFDDGQNYRINATVFI